VLVALPAGRVRGFTGKLAGRVEVPEPDGAIFPGADQPRTVRAKGAGLDPTGVPFQGLQAAPALYFPKPDGAVRATPDHPPPVRAKGYGVDRAIVPFLAQQRPARSQVPQPDLPVRASGRQQPAIPADGNRAKGVESIGKDRPAKVGTGQKDVPQVHTLKMPLP